MKLWDKIKSWFRKPIQEDKADISEDKRVVKLKKELSLATKPTRIRHLREEIKRLEGNNS